MVADSGEKCSEWSWVGWEDAVGKAEQGVARTGDQIWTMAKDILAMEEV